MTTFAQLGIEFTTRTAAKAANDIDKVEKSAARAEKTTTALSGKSKRLATDMATGTKGVRKATDALTKMQGGARKATKALAGLAASYATFAAVGASITMARDFNAALAETSTLLDGTPAQMEALRTGAMDLAGAYGGSSTAQVKAFYQAISAGAGSVSNAAKLLDQANKLAIGGVTNVTTGVDALTTAMNAYAADGLTAAQASDALFVGMKAGKTTVGELSSALGQVVPIAAAAGISFDEVVAGVSALTTQGQTTAMATTGLRQVIASVIAPTKQATDMAAQLGIAFNAQALEADGLAAFLDQVIKKTGGNTEAMAQLFGSVEALNAALAFAGGAGGTFSEIMDEMAVKAGATDAAFVKVADSLDKRMSFAFGKIGVLITQFGTAILTVTVPALEAMAAGADFLSQNFDSVTGIVISSAAAMTAYYLPAVYGAVTATGAWVASLITLKGALIATGVGALVVGAGLLVGEFLKLVRATGGWGEAMSLLGDVVAGVWDGIVGSAKAIVPGLGAIWEYVKSGFFTLLGSMQQKWAEFLRSVVGGMQSVGSVVPGMENAILAVNNAAISAQTGVYDFELAANNAGKNADDLKEKAAGLATDGFGKVKDALDALNITVDETTDSLGTGTSGPGLTPAATGAGKAATGAGKAAKGLAAEVAKLNKAAAAGKTPLEKYRSELAKLEDLKKLGLTDAAYSMELERINEELANGVPIIGDVADAWADFVVNGFRDFEGFVDSVLDSFKSMMAEMISTAARNQIIMSMGMSSTGTAGSVAASAATGGSGGIGSLLGLGNTASSLFGGGGFMSSIGTGLGGVLSGGGLGASFANLGGLMTGASSGLGALGAALPALGIAIAGVALLVKGFSKKYAGTALRGTVDQEGFDGRSFDFYRGGFLTGDKVTDKAVPDEISLYLDTAMTGVAASIETYADALGKSAKKALQVTGEEFTIWLDKLDEQGIIDALNSEVETVANSMAELVLGTDKFTRAGETAMETLERLGQGIMAVNDVADLLGHRIWNIGLASADAASELVELFGGLDAMTTAVNTYFAAVYSEEEQLAINTRRLTEVFADLGLAMPQSRDQYRALVEGLDTTTDAGAELYATLISMAGAMDAVLPTVSALTTAILAMQGVASTDLSTAISSYETAAKANETAAANWYKASDSIRTYIDKLRGSETSLTNPLQARAYNEAQYQTTLASALAGDLEAAGNLTSVAESLRSSVNDTASTKVEAALAEARILSDLNLASGVGDIEGARHDVIAGLLTDQADLMQEVSDYLADGNALTEDQIATLTTQLGSLDDAIAAAELINYAYLKERLAVTVDVLADADVPVYLRNLLSNAADGVTGYIDFITRSDLTPDLKWLAMTGASEHVKTVEYLADNRLGRDLTTLAVSTVSTLEKTVNLLAGSGLDRDTMQVALAGNSELSRVVNATLAADIDAQAKKLALGNLGAYSVSVMASLSPNVGADVRQIVFEEQGTYAAVIEAAISGDMSDRGRRILLTQQGSYIANITGILVSDMPDSIRTLLLETNTGAARSITVRKVWADSLTKADKELLSEAETNANRVISAMVKTAGISATGLLFLAEIGAGDDTISKTMIGDIALSSLSSDQRLLLESISETVTKSVAFRATGTATADQLRLLGAVSATILRSVNFETTGGLTWDQYSILDTVDGTTTRLLKMSVTGSLTDDQLAILTASAASVSRTLKLTTKGTLTGDQRNVLLAAAESISRSLSLTTTGGLTNDQRVILGASADAFTRSLILRTTGILTKDQRMILEVDTDALTKTLSMVVYGSMTDDQRNILSADDDTKTITVQAGFEYLSDIGTWEKHLLDAKDLSFQSKVNGAVNTSIFAKYNWAAKLITASDLKFKSTLTGKTDLSAFTSSTWRAKMLSASDLKFNSTLTGKTDLSLFSDPWRAKMLDANGLAFSSTLKGYTDLSLFSSNTWRAKMLSASDLSFDSTLTGKAAKLNLTTRQLKLLDAAGLSFDSKLTGKAKTLELTNRQFKMLDAANLTFDSTLNGDVNLDNLSDAQKALLDAVNGSLDGKLTLGGTFAFDPSTSFETLLADSIETPMANAKTAMDTLTGSLSDLRAAIAADTLAREDALLQSKILQLEANGTQAATAWADSKEARTATAQDLRSIFSSAGVTSTGKGISYQNGQLTSDGYWSGTEASFTKVMDSLKSSYGVSGNTIAQLTSKIFADVNGAVPEAKDNLTALRKAYRELTGEAPSFAGGGYTGDGSRSGGLDGKGGFMAMLHPRETVTDHTKSGQNDELVAELRALKAELRDFKQQSARYDYAQTKAVKETATLAQKADVKGVTIAKSLTTIPVEVV